MNPLCGCGCRQEVARPWNRYIHGHQAKCKISPSDLLAIREARKDGVSAYKLAKIYKVSPAWIYHVVEFGVSYGLPYGRSIKRAEDLAAEAKIVEENNKWRKAKRTLKEIRKMLRDPQKLREAASKQGQTSRT